MITYYIVLCINKNLIRFASRVRSKCCSHLQENENAKTIINSNLSNGLCMNDVKNVNNILLDISQYMSLQSDKQEEEVKVESGEVQQIVSFTDATTGAEAPSSCIYDSIMSDIFTPDFELGNFLSRPVQIHSYTVPLGVPFPDTFFNPWHNFLNKTQIKRKLDNYGYIQCTLKIKAVINATPFIYGAVGMSYQPQQGLNNISDFNYNPTCLSQRQTIYITPQDSSGGVMELPFFHYKNWLEMHDSSQVTNMGQIKMWNTATSRVANAGMTVTPTITVYAWAENVRLAANTSKLALQSSPWVIQSKEDETRPAENTNDEYGQTPVAKTASAVAGVAGTIAKYTSGIPILGTFAKATSLGAGVLSTVASIFGFTNVPVIDNASPYKSMPFHGLASSEIGNVVDKLTLDPKNELSISPSTVGLPSIDELAINHITAKSAILNNMVWEMGQASDTLLFGANITPTMCNRFPEASQTILLDTPMGMASRLFSNWRGDIIFKFKIVASPYHQGRLRVSYDPVGNIYLDSDTTTVVQTRIIDIAETHEFEIRIPYMAPTSWLRVREGDVTDYSYSTIGLPFSEPAYDNDFHNGRLTVRVLNELTAPDNTADVEIIAFVRAADNFELSNPSDIDFPIGNPNHFTVQSHDQTWNADSTEHVMGKSTPPPPNRYLVNMGESVQSLRVLLRRSHYINTERASDTNATNDSSTFYKFTMTKYPPSSGYDPNGMHTAVGLVSGLNEEYNFTTINPYTWIAACFVGQRGSMIWHFNVGHPGHIDVLRARRITETDVVTRSALRNITTNVVSSSFSATSRGMLTRGGVGASGLSLVNQKTQTGLSVLFPQYNKNRFVSASPTNAVFGIDEDDTENEKIELDIITSNKVDNTITWYERYCSIGTDFNFFYFLNVPPRYVYSTPGAGSY